jgi:serine/threonine-protein kinase
MLGSMVAAGPTQSGNERGSASSQYDLLARLAAGGMAEIFLARANSLAGFERYVVLKRIRPERGDDARWVAMFLDEARLAAQLQHPNIAQVFDLGQIGDEYFYTMEYVHGEDVLDILARTVEIKQKMPVQVALAIIAHAAGGLAHAHERCAPDGRPLGIVHRDITPSNLMVSYEGTVKIVDFGVAKARFRTTETQAGTIMGKVAYLSPEQCTTGTVDHRSDIFSLGIVLYEMLTGTRLFKRENDYETLRAVAADHPIAPSAVVAGLPRGLDEIVLRALAKNPLHRFATAHAMLDAIEQCAEAANISITSNVLRRYMRDLYGTREEPWRELERAMIPMLEDSDIELVEESAPRALAGLPMDAAADSVPMLQEGTGMIDLEALFGTQLSRDSRPSHGGYPVHPQPIPTGSILMVPLPVPNARPATQTSLLRVATGSADGVPYPVRRTLNTAAVRRPRTIATVLITAIAVVAIAAIVYVMAARDSKTTPAASIVGSGSSGAAPTVTHIEEPKVAPVVAKPAPPPLPPPPAPVVTQPAVVAAPVAKSADKPKPESVKPAAPPAPAAAPKPAAKPDAVKKKDACSDPLDCQY